MTPDDLCHRLDAERIVTIPAAEWDTVAAAFQEVERHFTVLAGDLLIVRCPDGLAAVEEPQRGERVLRRLADEAAAQEFVQDRLDAYERMWDGCGCKVDYYS